MKEFDRIIGYVGIRRELEQTADILRNLGTYRGAGAKTPSGMLIHGAPGLGKSLMAECLIEAAGVPTFTVRKDKADGAFVDLVRDAFDQSSSVRRGSSCLQGSNTLRPAKRHLPHSHA
ncbi:MAG: AAA family ATPase [Eggerthellaceae bacterium]|nr:AAA family ATPase [Eggerthellaceae bacterium]